MKKSVVAILLCAIAIFGAACNQKIEETVLTGDTSVPYEKLGMNMFFGNKTAGDLATQMNDIKSLGINFVRATFWFDYLYMPTETSSRNFSRFDEVINTANSAGLEVLPILAYVPNWLKGRADWKTVYINEYVKPMARRYAGRVKYWEIWNEPDEITFGVLDGSPEDYFDLLQQASIAIRAIDPSAKIVSAATANIVADGLAKFTWTQKLIDLGLSQYADIMNIHYYNDLDIELSVFGNSMVQSSGVNVWVTETGKLGQAGQKDYFERNLPYIDKSLNPERIFWYCYVAGAGPNEENPPEDTYGLVTVSGGVRYESSLYQKLKSR